MSYSEGYNAPTSSNSFINGLNVANDDLNPERAKMWDFSIQGLIEHTKIDYQVSVFRLNIKVNSRNYRVLRTVVFTIIS